jgi:hypothetical protein
MERNGINDIFLETERNETENIWEDEKRKETWRISKKRNWNEKIIPFLKKKITKNVEKKLYSFLGIWVQSK